MFVTGGGFHASELAGREGKWTEIPELELDDLTLQFPRKSVHSQLNVLSPPPHPLISVEMGYYLPYLLLGGVLRFKLRNILKPSKP